MSVYSTTSIKCDFCDDARYLYPSGDYGDEKFPCPECNKKSYIKHLEFVVDQLIGLNEISYNEGYKDRKKLNKKDYIKSGAKKRIDKIKMVLK